MQNARLALCLLIALCMTASSTATAHGLCDPRTDGCGRPRPRPSQGNQPTQEGFTMRNARLALCLFIALCTTVTSTATAHSLRRHTTNDGNIDSYSETGICQGGGGRQGGG